MGFKEAFYSSIEQLTSERGAETKFAGQSKLLFGTLNKIKNRVTKDPGLSSISKIIDSLDNEQLLSFVKQLRPEVPIEVINLEGKRDIAVFDIAEINTLLNFDDHHKSQADLHRVFADNHDKILFKVQVPSEFFPSDFGLRIDGRSMEPIVPHKAAAGFTWLHSWAEFTAGEMYLCNLPFEEGLVVRQVVVAQRENGLRFQPVNPDRNRYSEQVHPPELVKSEDMVLARMTWVAARY